MDKKTIILPDGYNGHTVECYTTPLEVRDGVAKLRVVGSMYLFGLIRLSELQAFIGGKAMILQVGKPYSEAKKHWPEGIDYNFRSGQHELRIFYRTPNRAEINSIRNGPALFSLSIVGPNIILAFKFEGFNWQDASYNWYLVPEEQRVLPEMPDSPEERAVLTIILVDAESGIVKALRFSSFSHKFTRKLHEAIIKQAQGPLPDDYEEQTQRLVKDYTPEYLVKYKSIVRCRLGD